MPPNAVGFDDSRLIFPVEPHRKNRRITTIPSIARTPFTTIDSIREITEGFPIIACVHLINALPRENDIFSGLFCYQCFWLQQGNDPKFYQLQEMLSDMKDAEKRLLDILGDYESQAGSSASRYSRENPQVQLLPVLSFIASMPQCCTAFLYSILCFRCCSNSRKGLLAEVLGWKT